MLALALSACGNDNKPSSSPKELKLWHYEGPDSAMGVAWNQAIKEFEATHPGVKVKFEEKGFEQIQKTAPMVLNSDDAPDIMEYNKGNATAGLLSKQGLLTDLSAEVTKRGWDKLLSPSVADHRQVRRQGRDGSAASGTASRTTREYVDGLLQQGPVRRSTASRCPTTFEEFTAAMDTFSQEGRHPAGRRAAPSTRPSSTSTSSR